MAQEMVGIRLPLMCAEVYGELREPDPQKGIVSSKTGFLGRANPPRLEAGGTGVPSLGCWTQVEQDSLAIMLFTLQ